MRIAGMALPHSLVLAIIQIMGVWSFSRMLALIAGVAACGGASRGPGAAPFPAAGTPEAATTARLRADSLRHPYTAADVAFMTRMIGHHSQAIVMSRLAPSHGASSSVRTLAERIINAQQDEIVLMQQWLRDRGQPVPDAGEIAGHMDHTAHAVMPGMLAPAQLRQLEEAHGAEFDRLFLTFMIQHHRGAITMVRELIATPGAAQDQSVFKLASDVNVDQTTEVERMTSMLASILFQPPPAR
jgi:uncharacterized protein (DUF305 family)